MKSVYDLKLHECIKVKGNGIDTEVTRVPGGWIYNLIIRTKTSAGVNYISSPVFVPWSNESQGAEDLWAAAINANEEKVMTADDVIQKAQNRGEPDLFRGNSPE